MKSSRVNGFLVIAIVLTVLLLAGVVFCGIHIVSEKMLSVRPKTFGISELSSMPKDGLSGSFSKVFQEKEFLPEFYMISKGTSISPFSFGFYIHFDVKTSNKTTDKLLAVGIDRGIHKGGLILVTTNNIAVVSPHGFFALNPDSWVKNDYLNLYYYLENWAEGDGNISGDRENLTDFSINDKTVSWTYHDNNFTINRKNLTFNRNYTLYSLITESEFIPTLPPFLFLGLIILFLILAGIFLWKIGNYDLSLACFYSIAAIVGVGGISLFIYAYLPISIVPLASFLSGGILFSIPIIMLWAALSLDKTLGYFWLIIGVITATSIGNQLFEYIWPIVIGIVFLTVIVLAICVPTKNK